MKILELKHNFETFSLDIKDMEFNRNKIIGLVGKNGAGKTTLMNCVSGNLKPNVKCELEDIQQEDILYIPSDLKAYEFLTVNEFLDLLIKYNETYITSKELIEILKLKGKENELICNLSQGMCKKISLAPIFIRSYRLLILDEPFNSIDINYIFELKKHLRNLVEICSIVISSHILDTLSDLCDIFYVIDEGNVVKCIVNDFNIGNLEREILNGNT